MFCGLKTIGFTPLDCYLQRPKGLLLAIAESLDGTFELILSIVGRRAMTVLPGTDEMFSPSQPRKVTFFMSVLHRRGNRVSACRF